MQNEQNLQLNTVYVAFLFTQNKLSASWLCKVNVYTLSLKLIKMYPLCSVKQFSEPGWAHRYNLYISYWSCVSIRNSYVVPQAAISSSCSCNHPSVPAQLLVVLCNELDYETLILFLGILLTEDQFPIPVVMATHKEGTQRRE